MSDIKVSFVEISVQLDKTTDVSDCSQLMVFGRFVKENAVEERFPFYKSLKTTTTGRDILNLVKDFSNSNEILLQAIGSIARTVLQLCQAEL